MNLFQVVLKSVYIQWKKFLKYSYLRMQNLKRLPNEMIHSCIAVLHIQVLL